ncbi:SDR family oxidoreductase [Sporobolomyces koalae]|uniref:SDR family oxidoreductase n=1 Tax=Sporobolomyces koalae TaxID=500713 RepID=UPI00316CBDA5
MTFTYLITGASRGLGLAYTLSLLRSSPSTRVVAAVRNPASGAELLKPVQEEFGDRLHVLECDVTSSESTQEAAQKLAQSGFVSDTEGLDAVLANAGVAAGGFNTATQASTEDLERNLAVNLYGVINTVNAFLPLLRKGQGKQIFVTSSLVGSIGGPLGQLPIFSTYAVSKAAVNMYTVKLARELADDGFTVIPFHPGYVKTDMNSGQGDLENQEAGDLAAKNVFLAAKKEDNAKFMVYDGTTLPW